MGLNLDFVALRQYKIDQLKTILRVFGEKLAALEVQSWQFHLDFVIFQKRLFILLARFKLIMDDFMILFIF
jgi:hypothetical protein